MLSTFWERGLKLAQQGDTETSRSNTQAANQLFKSSLNHFAAGLKYEKDKTARKMVEAKMMEIESKLKSLGDSPSNYTCLPHAKPTPSPTIGNSQYQIAKAEETVKKAILEDNKNNPAAAIPMYLSAVKLYLCAVEDFGDEIFKAKVKAEVEKYVKRAELLRSNLERSQMSSASALPPASSPLPHSVSTTKPPHDTQHILQHDAVPPDVSLSSPHQPPKSSSDSNSTWMDSCASVLSYINSWGGQEMQEIPTDSSEESDTYVEYAKIADEEEIGADTLKMIDSLLQAETAEAQGLIESTDQVADKLSHGLDEGVEVSDKDLEKELDQIMQEETQQTR